MSKEKYYFYEDGIYYQGKLQPKRLNIVFGKPTENEDGTFTVLSENDNYYTLQKEELKFGNIDGLSKEI